VLTTLDVGGAEMHVLSLARGQVERGHRVRVLFLKGAGTLVDDFLAAGAESAERAGAAALWRELRGADVVHSHLLKADALCAALAPLAGRRRRLVASKHNDERALLRLPVSLAHGVLGRVPRRTIVLSDHVGRFVERHGRVPGRLVRRIYYGIDPKPWEEGRARGEQRRAELRAEFGFRADDVVFLCVARFAPQKAHDVLLRAAARAAELEGGARVRVLLVGDDPFGEGRVRAQALAAQLGLAGRVAFAGIRRDVPDLMGASDAFVLASLWEGLGLVFLEAMAAERCVLATDVSAVPEVVVQGETGLLVPAGDPEPLARGLARLASDPDERARMGAAGRARVLEHFGLDRMVDETLAVYGELDA
jgi:glycosyltransferase involved in cell wall biosynthesis